MIKEDIIYQVTVRNHGVSANRMHNDYVKPDSCKRVTGWSRGAALRNSQFLQCVDYSAINAGLKLSVTLTVKNMPTFLEWRKAVNGMQMTRLRQQLSCLAYHYVVEWQRSGKPHLHMFLVTALPEEPEAYILAYEIIRDYWRGYFPEISYRSQHVRPVYHSKGWAEYTGKHASRGIWHYQRKGIPVTWAGTGRMWGYGGNWPRKEETYAYMNFRQYVVFRRRLRAWKKSNGVMLKEHGHPSSYGYPKGTQDWIDSTVVYQLLNQL